MDYHSGYYLSTDFILFIIAQKILVYLEQLVTHIFDFIQGAYCGRQRIVVNGFPSPNLALKMSAAYSWLLFVSTSFSIHSSYCFAGFAFLSGRKFNNKACAQTANRMDKRLRNGGDLYRQRLCTYS